LEKAGLRPTDIQSRRPIESPAAGFIATTIANANDSKNCWRGDTGKIPGESVKPLESKPGFHPLLAVLSIKLDSALNRPVDDWGKLLGVVACFTAGTY
jgi:hypothetical protein